ncbi:PRC-barrel domain-containing protein [Endobacterium cereale]|uniref:PRC-barrel domain-containing protein n=1 Tax=Endobacterium cereale TaxID=2663029 RepID=UPI002B49FA1F|nr:PRC-barrel domain-containing protein [Endobacterium cereale]MEB2848351.1 PRC-barrel domain-containing protein [Endobacterium cereale]
MKKLTLSAIILSAAIPATVLAQTSATTPAPTTEAPAATNQNKAPNAMSDQKPMDMASDQSAETAGPFITVPEMGAWRVTDLEGKAVYGAENESIGEINDVLVSQDGSINAVIIGVGGFLGIGEKNVAVDMSALQLGPGANQQEADAASTTAPSETPASTTNGNTAGTPPATTPAPGGTTVPPSQAPAADERASADNNIKIGEDGLPERIVLNVTRQQLEEAPAFEGVESAPKQ